MKRAFLALAAASLAITSTAHAATDKVAEKGEAKLAKMLKGRVAGKPQSCIPAMLSNNLHIIDHTAMVYDAGGTIYVSRPADPKSLDTDDIVVINRFGSQLCKQDIIRTVDRMSGFTTGVIFMGDWIPYTKP